MFKKTLGIAALAIAAVTSAFAQTPEFNPALSKRYTLGQGWVLGKVVQLEGGGYRANRTPSPFPPGTILASALERERNEDLVERTTGYFQLRSSLVLRSITAGLQTVDLSLVCESFNREFLPGYVSLESRTFDTETIGLTKGAEKEVDLHCTPYGGTHQTYKITLREITPKGAVIDIK